MLRVAALALSVVVIAAPAHAETRRYDFEVRRNDSRIGTHVVTVEKTGDEMVVNVAVDLAVTFGPFTLYRYKHRSIERWRGGRLVKLDADTDDDGTKLFARAWEEGGKVLLDGPEGRQAGPADILPSSYWNGGLRTAKAWLETHWGTISNVTVTRLPPVTLNLPGRTVQAIPHHIVSPKSDVTPLYTEDGEWVGLIFDLWGAHFDYILQAAP